MSLKESVFGSKSEKRVFKHLVDSGWSKHFNLYHNLPFANVFDVDSLCVEPKEKNFLLKTSIDYTICDKNDRPLMCIEFDGMCGGYSREGEYVQKINNDNDPARKWKLDLKLRIARMEHFFPFYIISFSETGDLVENKISLWILDSIIGQTIAGSKMQEKIQEYSEIDKENWESLPKEAQREYLQDLVFQAEVEAELEWDPVAHKGAEIFGILSSKDITYGYGCVPLQRPELPDLKNDFDTEGLKGRLEAWKKIEWFGHEVSCKTPKGVVSAKAWVRNFDGSIASPITISMNIAELLTYYKAAVLNGVDISKIVN